MLPSNRSKLVFSFLPLAVGSRAHDSQHRTGPETSPGRLPVVSKPLAKMWVLIVWCGVVWLERERRKRDLVSQSVSQSVSR